MEKKPQNRKSQNEQKSAARTTSGKRAFVKNICSHAFFLPEGLWLLSPYSLPTQHKRRTEQFKA
eukprot:999671-Amphidinium_carterae.1